MRIACVLVLSAAVLAQDVDALIEAAYDDTYEGRVAGLRALRDAGPGARDAVHPLRELRGTGHDRRIHTALAAIGTAGVPPPELAGADQEALVAALKSKSARTRGQAAYYLRSRASRNAKLVEPLAAALDHPSAYARHHVHRALQITGFAQAVFERESKHADVRRRRLSAGHVSSGRLIELLDDEDATVRRRAVDAIAQKRLRKAAPRLLLLLETDPALRGNAWFALALMQAPEVVPLLADGLASDDVATRVRASEYLWYVRDRAVLVPALPALIRALFDDEWPVRSNVYRVLAAMGAKAAPAAPYLAEIVEASANDRAHAKSTLTRIGAGIVLPPQPAAADLDALLAQLADKDAAGCAAFQLGRLGDTRALAGLRGALASKDGYIRRHAAFALERIGLPAIPALVDALTKGDGAARRLAIDSLRRIGLLARKPAPEVFQRALADEDPEVRRIAAVTLGDFGWKRAVPDLVRLVRNGEAGALWALASLGEDATPAVPVLTERLANWEDRSKDHVDFTIRALGAIGPAAEPAVPLIVDAALWGRGLDSTALTALVAMGAPGHVGLVEVIERATGHIRKAAIERLMASNLNPPGLRAALEKAAKDPIAKDAALRALGQFGGDRPVDVASLMASMELEPLNRFAKSGVPYTLAKVAQPEQLIPYLDDKDERKRWCAWRALAQMTLTADHKKALEPKIAKAMRETGIVRGTAAALLVKVPPTRITDDLLYGLGVVRLEPGVLTAIVRLSGARERVVAALAHKDPAARRGALALVRGFEPRLIEALPALAKAMAEDPRSFNAYLSAIMFMREAAVPILLAYLPTADSSQRRRIFERATSLGDGAVPLLHERFAKGDATTRLDILGLLGRFQAKALPTLLTAVRDDDDRVRALALYHLGKVRGHSEKIVPVLVNALPHRSAVSALSALGSDAAAGVKRAAASPDPEVRIAVMNLHGRFGEEGIKRIGEALADDVPEVRRAAARAARYLRMRARPLVPALQKAMRDPDPDVRREASSALAAVGGDSLPILMERFEKGDAVARREVVRALGKMGDRALPTLLKAARDQDREVRRYSFIYLGKLPKHADKIVPVLANALPDSAHALRGLGPQGAAALERATRSKKAPVRRAAFEVIAYLGDDAVPLLRAGLRDTDARVRSAAANAAKELKERARSLAKALTRAMGDPDTNVRRAAAAALARTGDDALPVLVAHIEDGDYDLRRTIMLMLAAAFGERGRAELYKAARAEDPDIRKVAYYQLGTMGYRAHEVVPILVAALPDRDAESALRRLGAHSAEGVKLGLRSPNPAVRASAMRAVHALQGEARAYIAKGLADKDAAVRAEAAEASVALKFKARPLIPALKKALGDPNERVRVAAVRALGAAGGAKAAMPDIVRLYRDGTSSDRSAAGEVLKDAGARALVPLMSFVLGQDAALGEHAASLLARMGPRGIGALVEIMGTGEDPALARAGNALRGRPETGVPALMKLLGHESATVRRNAAWRIGQTKRHAVPAIDALIKTLPDKDEFVAGQAAWALGEIGPAAKPALPALNKMVASGRAPDIARASIRKIEGK